MKTKKLKKYYSEKKTPNYHGPWVPNLIKILFYSKRKHKITMAMSAKSDT